MGMWVWLKNDEPAQDLVFASIYQVAMGVLFWLNQPGFWLVGAFVFSSNGSILGIHHFWGSTPCLMGQSPKAPKPHLRGHRSVVQRQRRQRGQRRPGAALRRGPRGVESTAVLVWVGSSFLSSKDGLSFCSLETAKTGTLLVFVFLLALLWYFLSVRLFASLPCFELARETEETTQSNRDGLL